MSNGADILLEPAASIRYQTVDTQIQYSIAISLKRIADKLGALNENTGNMNSNLFHNLDAIRNNLAR